jgi:hypothetical protein
MNTDFHFDITTIKDEYERVSFLLGKLCRAYRTFDIADWKEQLWKLTVAASSDTHEYNTGEQIDFNTIVSGLKGLVEEAWAAMQVKERFSFQHEFLSMPWKVNPYAIKIEKFNDTKRYYTSYLREHSGKITVLSRSEINDFFLVFEGFFRQLDVISWLKLLDTWLKFAETDSSIICSGFDYAPLETYLQLLRLIEACYLADEFGFSSGYYPPNNYLFDRDYMMQELYSETYDGYNPFLQLTWIFCDYSLPELKKAFHHWMDCAKNKEKIYSSNEPAQLLSLHSDVVKLLEIGWLLIYTEEMPQHWLNPETFDPDNEYSQIHIQEEECVTVSDKEKYSPNKALKKYYKKHSWYHYQRMNLNDALHYALQSKTEYYDVDIFIDLEKSISKLIEILYLINQEFHSGLKNEN